MTYFKAKNFSSQEENFLQFLTQKPSLAKNILHKNCIFLNVFRPLFMIVGVLPRKSCIKQQF